ncbi:MAG: PRC-barrel domain-containing protein [Ramlibacter sp.]
MKTQTRWNARRLPAVLAALAIAGATGLAHAQVAGTFAVASAELQVREVAQGWSVARHILGRRVVNDNDVLLGRVKDIVVAPDASVTYVIVGAGGFLGVHRHDVAIPVSVFAIDGDKLVLAGATPDLIKTLPAFEYAREQPGAVQ